MDEQPDLLGRRIGAALLDFVLLVLIFAAVVLAVGGSDVSNDEPAIRFGDNQALVFAVLGLVYYGLSEALTGQTLGKKSLGLKVVSQDGSPARTGQVIIRTLLRVVDQLPFLYLLGLIVMLVTGRERKRIGDIVAKTRVVAAEKTG